MQLYLRFLRYVKPYGSLALAASLSFVVSGFLGAYPIQLFKRAVDTAMAPDAPGGLPGTARVSEITYLNEEAYEDHDAWT